MFVPMALEAFSPTRRAMLASLSGAVAFATLPRGVRAQSDRDSERKRSVVITIDDGPVTGAMEGLDAFTRIARGLREAFVAEGVPAIMFINERQLHVDGERDARVRVVQEWLDAGLDLGNHTYSHLNLESVGVPRFLDDIVKGEVVSRALLQSRGKQLTWFRYPFLSTGRGDLARTVELFLAERGYRIAPVTVDYHDYSFARTFLQHHRRGNAPEVEQHFGLVLQALQNAFARAEVRSMEVLGYELPQTLLIHCNEMNALTLRRTIGAIRDRGYRFVSINNALEDPAYKTANLRPGGIGGGGFFNSLAAVKAATSAKS
jgi:peptidoglycan/xylan/chitin deacetylase (PgdA/CDA1 family)